MIRLESNVKRCQNSLMNEAARTHRRVSAIAGLDRVAVRELCDLHPWDLGRLCEAAGVDRTVLSHFFAGRRPLPQRVAVGFLRQLGMHASGDLDPQHGFFFYVRPGYSELAAKWVERLFPGGGKRLEISNDLEVDESGSDPAPSKRGVLLVDGNFAAVVQDAAAREGSEWIRGTWEDIGHEDEAGALLDHDHLPSRAVIAAAVQGVPTFERYVWDDPDWDQVKREAIRQGRGAREVLTLLQASRVNVQPATKTLFARRAGPVTKKSG